MPHLYEGARAPEGSTSGSDPSRSAPNAPQSTHSTHRNASSASASSAPPPPEAPGGDWLSLDALQAFPAGLWRMPIPNALFDRRAELSEAGFRTALAFCYLAYRFVPSGRAREAVEAGPAVEDAEDAESGSAAASGTWTCPVRTFQRAALQAASGLSDTATRNALDELAALGWVAADKSGTAFRYRWTREVPTERFTQVPTVLLETLPALPTGTAFDVFWQVLRGTWGWTAPTPPDCDAGLVGPRVHRRWAQLSVNALAVKTGRSAKSVKPAIKRLQGQWIERVRPSTGAAQFRVLPEALVQLAEVSPLSRETANELPPGRQRTSPPLKEPTSSKRKNKQARTAGREPEPDRSPQQASSPSAVPANLSSHRARPPCPRCGTKTETRRRPSNRLDPRAAVPEAKREAFDHLLELGMWPGRAARVCRRYSLRRLRRNVGYYHRQTEQHPVQTPGAWLYHAITDDFAFEKTLNDGGAALPALKHKGRYTLDEKRALVQTGTSAGHFHRAAGDPETPWMYLGEDGPGQRWVAA